MIRPLYIVLEPEDLQGEDSEICHLIKAEHDTESDSWTWPEGKKTRCSKYELNEEMDLDSSTKVSADNDNDVRLYLAKQQNAGIDLCADCMASFYSSDSE